MAMLAVEWGERRWIECRGACAMSLYLLSLGGMLDGFGSCLLDKEVVLIGTDYEEMHCLSGKVRSHQANTWWQVDSVLCQLYSFEPGHATSHIPHSALPFRHPPDF